MNWIDKYKSVKEDQQLGKGKVKIIPQERRDSGQTDTTITTDLGEILLDSQDLLIFRQLMRCFENRCIRF